MSVRRSKEKEQRIPLVGGLFRRLFIHHIVLVTVPIALLGVLLVNIARSAVNRALEQDNVEIANRARGEIEGYADYVREQLKLAAVALEGFGDEENPSILDAFRAERFLNQIRSAEVTAFRKMYAVDTLGVLVATTDFAATGLPPGSETAVRAVLDTAFFHTVTLDAETATRGGDELPEVLPTVLMAARLTSLFGEKMGAALAEVRVDSIWAVIDNIRVGEEGHAFLVNGDGIVIAHPQKELVYQTTDYSHLPSVQSVTSGQSGHVTSEQVTEGAEPVMAAYGPIRAPGLEWGLVIHRPLSEVYATRDRMRLQIFTVVIIGIALALISTLVYTRRLVRPLGALAEGANRLSQGDLDYKIPAAGRDELGTLATEFNVMVEQLSRIQERLRRVEHLDTLAKFSSVVAHEIRNPLNAMQINLHLLQERVDDEEIEYLDVISTEIRRLENLVREFQDISRPPVLSIETLDVNELIRDVVNLQKGTADTQHIEIRLDLDERVPAVEADRNRITQAVLNLILNAIQAMPEGGLLDVTTARWEEITGGLTITVADTGEGIPKEELSRVFDFYYTLRDSGSGLGLSVAQQIVDEHGGQITLASAAGEGTTARIHLPPTPPPGRTANDVLT